MYGRRDKKRYNSLVKLKTLIKAIEKINDPKTYSKPVEQLRSRRGWLGRNQKRTFTRYLIKDVQNYSKTRPQANFILPRLLKREANNRIGKLSEARKLEGEEKEKCFTNVIPPFLQFYATILHSCIFCYSPDSSRVKKEMFCSQGRIQWLQRMKDLTHLKNSARSVSVSK